MSDEQQQAAIGRTVEEYLNSKKKLAALQSEAIKIGSSVSQVGQHINQLGGNPALSGPGPTIGYIDQSTADFPTGSALRALAMEIKNEFERKRVLAAQLKNMGLDQKD